METLPLKTEQRFVDYPSIQKNLPLLLKDSDDLGFLLSTLHYFKGEHGE